MESSFAGRYANVREGKFQFRLRQHTEQVSSNLWVSTRESGQAVSQIPGVLRLGEVSRNAIWTPLSPAD
jgi:hypothetical protein